MRTLILSCSTGEGHNSCAKAIKEIYDANAEYCIIKDVLSFISDKTADFFSKGHAVMYRQIPSLFRFGYRYAEKHPALFLEDAPVYRFLTQASDGLFAFLCSEQIESVICTHVFSSLILTDILKKYPISLKTCFVATDYTCSPSTRESSLDYYFIPAPSIAKEYESPNIPSSHIISSGIPVRQEFYFHVPKEKAKVLLQIPPESKHIVMMCGSMGCGPMKRLTHKLAKFLKNTGYITVICGTNQKLRQELEEKYKGSRHIRIYGYVHNMSLILDSADLYLTKPGGISVTEAAIKGIPMVLIRAVAGCEDYNSLYFVSIGCAQTAAHIGKLTSVCCSVFNDDEHLKYMGSQYSSFPKQNASQLIFDIMERQNNYEKYKQHS